MRTPTRAQRLFASRWPVRAWLVAVPLLCAVAPIAATAPEPVVLTSGSTMAWMLVVMLVAGAAGYFGAGLAAALLLGPIYRAREVRNGGPFRVGDRVRILAGAHRGRVTRVYSTWRQGLVRVELGEAARSACTDIFSGAELVREHDGSATTCDGAEDGL
jgi:hypothetical protein